MFCLFAKKSFHFAKMQKGLLGRPEGESVRQGVPFTVHLERVTPQINVFSLRKLTKYVTWSTLFQHAQNATNRKIS